ncbi:MAG: endonuclease/exonuclease/phosphatase family protein [Bacteroidales bacterium]|nr:endonuclease/exonuclease/phosphatase family protein [Bacteroidales bacterium]MCF8403119.1 endonuclease/exonuclease/phosphatase family protein [Bacteroidales bacterium]
MKKILISAVFFLSILIAICPKVIAQPKVSYEVVCIGFYNLENLFDTINDTTLRGNDEFTPGAPKQWTNARYHEKLGNMAFAISKIGTDLTPDGPALLGVSEIENRGVLEDLVKEQAIKDKEYKIVHYDSPDYRGVDVGLIYQPKYFTVTNSASHMLWLEGDSNWRSRDQLVVTGLLLGEEISIIVNHWPSRSGGEKKSRPKRNAAGALSRHIVDSLLSINPNAKIMVMGDLNDDPVNPSVKEFLRTQGREKDLEEGDLFNPYFKLYKDGIGSLAYRDNWNLFDQIIISQGLLGEEKDRFKFYKAMVFNKNYLKQKDGAYAGYPWRTFAGGRYIAGYSDHFPVFIGLVREAK